MSSAPPPGRKRTGSELLSRTLECSIIAAEALNDRVRDGNGCIVLAMATSPKGWLHRKLGNGFPQGHVACPLGLACPAGWSSLRSPGRAGPFWGACSSRGKRGQAARLISTGKLNALPRLHFPPIDPVVFRVPSGSLRSGRTRLRGGLALRCFQRLSFRDIATRHCRWRDNRNTRGHSLPVLSY